MVSKGKGIIVNKISWSERSRYIAEKYPSTVSLDWHQVFKQDPHILGKIISDIFKLESSSGGRPGKRPAVDRHDAEQHLRRYDDDDYTILSFKEAFTIMKGTKSFRGLANKCGLSLNMTQRLLSGSMQPTIEVMEKIAKAFKKHPSYFIEYRISYILGMLSERMLDIPEASIVPYKKLQGESEKKK